MNVSKFIKDNTPLCVCTLGIAIIGYLGYHAVRWIINKCQNIKKIDHVGQNKIQQLSSHSPQPLINRVSSLEISPDKINMGQGEYVVFHKLPSGEKKELSPETFEQVYKILNHYSPAALMNSGSEKANEECANRYENIKSKVKELDSSLEIIFVPRTLIELIFIRKCIREDLKNNEICPFLSIRHHDYLPRPKDSNHSTRTPEDMLERIQALRNKRKCWHLCYFDDEGDNEHVGIKNVAYRLNQYMAKAFNPSSEGFTHQEFSAFAEKEIEFLKAHHKKCNETGAGAHVIGNCSAPGPTTNFGNESYRDQIKPMGIRTDSDAQIIRNAITLDCSKVAQESFFVYRGADFQKEAASSWDDKDTPYSLSYGTSLFAGCIYDGGATAFHFMRKQENAYAIPVPFDQLNSSPFFIPTTHNLVQLFSMGEKFHVRTKAWKDFDVSKIRGISSSPFNNSKEHLKSNLTQDELISQFAEYKNRAIQLK